MLKESESTLVGVVAGDNTIMMTLVINILLFFFLFFLRDTKISFCFFFQAEDGIRDRTVTGVQTCALPILHCELEAPLMGERRVCRLLAVEDDLERRILAVRQPEVPTGVQLYIERYGVAGRGDIGEHTGVVRLFVAAILVDGAEVGLEGEVEWLGRFEHAVRSP